MIASLIGCKKEEAEPLKPAPALVTDQATDSKPVIVTFGDSLSAGFGVDAGLSYPDFLQKELDDAGFAYRVRNEGISGDTSGGGAERLARVLQAKPAVVILELGANDGLRGIPVAKTRENLDRMVAQIKTSGAQLLLVGITLPRNYGADYIREFDRIYPDLAKKYNVARLPFLLEGVALNPKLMQPDALHPTAEGNEIVARNVMKALTPLLKK